MFQVKHAGMRARMMSISSRATGRRANVQARILYPSVSRKHGCVRGRSPSKSGRESTHAGSKSVDKVGVECGCGLEDSLSGKTRGRQEGEAKIEGVVTDKIGG